MKNKLSSFLFITALLTIASVVMNSCKKNDVVTPNQEVAGFSSKSGSYFITNSANSVFKIPVGVTSVPNTNRTINFTVSSPSGAEEGQQYTLGTTSVTIPAGTTVDSISLKGLFSGYASGRKDTLVFKITGGDIPSLVGSDEYTLYMQKYCDVDLASFAGSYTKTYDIDPSGTYGPYTASISDVTPLTATTGTIKITDFALAEVYPSAISPITVILDWTDPANFKATIPAQILVAGDFLGYGPLTVTGVGTSTFSSCDNTFTINYKLTVSAGSFGNFKTTLAR